MKTPVVVAVLATLALPATPSLAQTFSDSPFTYVDGSGDGPFRRVAPTRPYDGDFVRHRTLRGHDPRSFDRFDRDVVVIDEYTETSRRQVVHNLPRARVSAGAYVGIPSIGIPYDVATYVALNPVRDVYTPYALRRGIRIPDNVYLRAVPGYAEYSYAYVNGSGVVVENNTRRVAYLY